jgi:hypothetical protein
MHYVIIPSKSPNLGYLLKFCESVHGISVYIFLEAVTAVCKYISYL